MKAIHLPIFAAGLLLAPCAPAVADNAPAAAAPAVNASLETAIPGGIKLLEAKDYKAFLKAFVPPDVYTKLTAEKGEDAFVERFAQGKAEKLLAVLKAIKEAKPKMEDDGKTAVYELPEEIAGKKTIQFVQIGGAWYIRN